MLRAIVQVVGFAIGLALLAWCVRLAFSDQNRAQLDRLRDASAIDLAILLALSAASLAINGLIFWATLLPVRRLRPTDVLSVNALATFLNYLPFKAGAISRFVIHSRRDGLPLLTVTAWLAAVVIVLLAVMGPMVAASLWRGRLDAAWTVTVAAGVPLSYLIVWRSARHFAGAAGLARIHAIAARLRLPVLRRLAGSRVFHHLHAGLTMLADPRALAACFALRVLDTGVQALRFIVAAGILGRHVGVEGGVLFASTYFLVGVFSPAGNLGTREGATTGLARLLRVPGSDAFATIALLISAADMLVNLAGAALGLAWLRPHKLLARTSDPAAPGEPTPPPTPPAPAHATIIESPRP